MICKCKMYLIKDGVLVCSVCGKPSGTDSEQIEDKNDTKIENKTPKKRR